MITWLIWTIWTSMSSVPKKADKLNLSLSLVDGTTLIIVQISTNVSVKDESHTLSYPYLPQLEVSKSQWILAIVAIYALQCLGLRWGDSILSYICVKYLYIYVFDYTYGHAITCLWRWDVAVCVFLWTERIIFLVESLLHCNMKNDYFKLSVWCFLPI